MAEKSMIVIGGGLAGLATGCYARMNGWRVRIFERHTVPGGVCTAWKRGPYTIDGCIHWLMGIKPGGSMHRIYRELGLAEEDRFLTLTRYVRTLDEPSGAAVDFTWDLERLAEDLHRVAPADRGPIGEFLEAVRVGRGFPMEMLKPRDLLGPLETAATLWRMRNGLQLLLRFRMPVREYARRFQSPVLRRMLESLFLPELPTSFLFLALGQLADGQLGLFRGGSQAFSDRVAARFRALGGELILGAPVRKIVVERDRAVGVRLEDGSEHRADEVVSAADGRATLFDMLGGRHVPPALRERYERWPLFRPIVLASFGVAEPFDGLPHAQHLHLARPIPHPGGFAESLHFRVMNYDPALAPPGHSVVQALFESDWDAWEKLRGQGEAYTEAKRRVAEELLDRLAPHLPGLRDRLRMTDVATPYTFWRYTRNHRGAFEGWLPTPEAVRAGMPRRLPGLDGFQMVGQWVDPGGGIPPALAGGRHLVLRLCRDEGHPFVATVP